MGATGRRAPHVTNERRHLSVVNVNRTFVGLGRPTMDSLSHDVSMHDWRAGTTHSSDHPRNSASKNETTISLADSPTRSAPEAHR